MVAVVADGAVDLPVIGQGDPAAGALVAESALGALEEGRVTAAVEE